MISHYLYTLTHCTQHSCSTAKSHSPIRQTIELGKSLAQLGKIMKFAFVTKYWKMWKIWKFCIYTYLCYVRKSFTATYVTLLRRALLLWKIFLKYLANYNKIRNSLKIAIIHSALTNLVRNIM